MSTENPQENSTAAASDQPTGGEPIPVKKKSSSHPYKQGCKCARCKRIALMEEEVIKNYLETLNKDRVILVLATETMEAIKRKFPELMEKFKVPQEYSPEDHVRLMNELANHSIIFYTEQI